MSVCQKREIALSSSYREYREESILHIARIERGVHSLYRENRERRSLSILYIERIERGDLFLFFI